MIRILSIDGGGIRGLVPLRILYIISKRIGIPLYELFDIITGTSTGAIIAGLLAIGIPVDDIVQFYLGNPAKKIFKQSLFSKVGYHCPKYDENNIESVLQEAFQNKTFKDCKTNLIIPSDSWTQRSARIFSTFEDRCSDLPVWEAVRASSAAETFFRAYKGMFDGGLYANNPTDLAVRDALKYLKVKSLNDLFVVSLGTGTMVEPMKEEDVNNMWFTGIASNIIGETMDRITSKTHDILEPLFNLSPTKNYFRLQFKCPKVYEAMDDVSDDNLNGLQNLADQNICNNWSESINYIINELKNSNLTESV